MRCPQDRLLAQLLYSPFHFVYVYREYPCLDGKPHERTLLLLPLHAEYILIRTCAL